MSQRLSIAKQLQTAIGFQLAQPPTCAGMRLKTMRELAEMVGVSRESVNRALNGLVEQGILVRKNGSGVYVRKVPSAAAVEGHDVGTWTQKLKNIASEDPVSTRLQPEPRHAQLRLDLWWSDSPLNLSGVAIQRGMIDQAREMGHKLSIRGLPLAPEAAAEKELPNAACDGHIVLMSVAETFKRFVQASQQPIVYVWTGNADPVYQPLVQIDMDEAFCRALRLLAKEGYKRIGILGWTDLRQRQSALYERTLGELGRTFRAAEFSDATEENDAAAVRRLFSRNDAPEALYVADDVMMRHIVPVLRELGREPGRNLALITFGNRTAPRLPAEIEWSQLVFDPYSVGRLAVQSLLREIESAGDELLSFSHQAVWRPGKTHRPAEF